jgi:hypothetical protein
MKKVSLLVLLALLASTLVMAAIPTSIVRLTIINKSGYDVYMKLEGSAITGGFYYLTVPSGTRDAPVVKVYTVMVDMYQRTTWQCNGAKSTGTLMVTGNTRLTFTPCGEMACWWVAMTTQHWGCDKASLVDVYNTHRIAGEPRMEKVVYFKYLQAWSHGKFLLPVWVNAYLYNGYFNYGCGVFYYRIRSYQLPYGCAWRYQY